MLDNQPPRCQSKVANLFGLSAGLTSSNNLLPDNPNPDGLSLSRNLSNMPMSLSMDLDMVGRSIQSLDSETGRVDKVENSLSLEGLATSRLEINGLTNAGQLACGGFRNLDEVGEVANNSHDVAALKINLSECGPIIPQILHLIGNDMDDTASASKRNGLQQLVEISVTNDASIWGKFFNQILTVVLEVLDYSNPLNRELALSLIIEMLKNQKTMMENSVEIVIEKLLNVTKDSVPKVIVPLLVAEDEKTLVVCINCLTKIVGPLSQSILTLPGGAQCYAVEVGHYLCQSNLASSGGRCNRQ